MPAILSEIMVGKLTTAEVTGKCDRDGINSSKSLAKVSQDGPHLNFFFWNIVCFPSSWGVRKEENWDGSSGDQAGEREP